MRATTKGPVRIVLIHMCVLVNRGTLGRNMKRVNHYKYIKRYITNNSRHDSLFIIFIKTLSKEQ